MRYSDLICFLKRTKDAGEQPLGLCSLLCHYKLTTIHYIVTTLTTLSLHCHYIVTTFHYISLHFTTFHYISLHFTTFHYISLHFTTFSLHSHNNSIIVNIYRPPSSSKKIPHGRIIPFLRNVCTWVKSSLSYQSCIQ